MIVGSNIGAGASILNYLADRAPGYTGSAPAHRPLGVRIEHEFPGVHRIDIVRIHGNVMVKALHLVSDPDVGTDHQHARRRVRREDVSVRDSLCRHQVRHNLSLG